MSNGNNKVREFVEKNKKPISIISGVLAAGALALVGYEIFVLWEQRNPKPHTPLWIARLSDAALDCEREKVRLAHSASGSNLNLACQLETLLDLFDDESEKRKAVSRKGYVFPVHGEHGTNLYKPD